MRRLISACALAALAMTGSASAHVVLATPEAAPNAYYAGEFRVSHGCGESPTTAFRIEIPEGINTARPQPKPGWTLEIERQPLPAPIETEYGQVTERVSAVTWRGVLPADQFDAFGLLVKLPDRVGPLYFRAFQTCENGGRAWVDIPADGQTTRPENSAPMLTLRRAPRPAPAQAPSDPHAHH
jgi:uncharacterized protein YcnI